MGPGATATGWRKGRCGIERCGIAIHLGCMHGGMIDPKWNKSGDLASQQCALRPPTCTLPFGPCVPACSCPAARESGTRWCLSGSSHMQPILGWPASPVALGCRRRTTAIGTELLLSRQLHDADEAGRRCDGLVASGMCDLPSPACSVHGSARVRSPALTAARSGWRGCSFSLVKRTGATAHEARGGPSLRARLCPWI